MKLYMPYSIKKPTSKAFTQKTDSYLTAIEFNVAELDPSKTEKIGTLKLQTSCDIHDPRNRYDAGDNEFACVIYSSDKFTQDLMKTSVDVLKSGPYTYFQIPNLVNKIAKPFIRHSKKAYCAASLAQNYKAFYRLFEGVTHDRTDIASIVEPKPADNKIFDLLNVITQHVAYDPSSDCCFIKTLNPAWTLKDIGGDITDLSMYKQNLCREMHQDMFSKVYKRWGLNVPEHVFDEYNASRTEHFNSLEISNHAEHYSQTESVCNGYLFTTELIHLARQTDIYMNKKVAKGILNPANYSDGLLIAIANAETYIENIFYAGTTSYGMEQNFQTLCDTLQSYVDELGVRLEEHMSITGKISDIQFAFEVSMGKKSFEI